MRVGSRCVAGGRGNPDPGATFAFDGRRACTKPSIPSLRLGGARPAGLFMGVAPGLRSEMQLLLARPASRGSRDFFLRRRIAALFGLDSGLGYFVFLVNFKFWGGGRGGREALHEDFRIPAPLFRQLFATITNTGAFGGRQLTEISSAFRIPRFAN